MVRGLENVYVYQVLSEYILEAWNYGEKKRLFDQISEVITLKITELSFHYAHTFLTQELLSLALKMGILSQKGHNSVKNDQFKI